MQKGPVIPLSDFMHNAGGSRSSNASILTRLHALAEAEQQLGQHTAALHQAQAALHSMATAAASHSRYTLTHHTQVIPCCTMSDETVLFHVECSMLLLTPNFGSCLY